MRLHLNKMLILQPSVWDRCGQGYFLFQTTVKVFIVITANKANALILISDYICTVTSCWDYAPCIIVTWIFVIVLECGK